MHILYVFDNFDDTLYLEDAVVGEYRTLAKAKAAASGANASDWEPVTAPVIVYAGGQNVTITGAILEANAVFNGITEVSYVVTEVSK